MATIKEVLKEKKKGFKSSLKNFIKLAAWNKHKKQKECSATQCKQSPFEENKKGKSRVGKQVGLCGFSFGPIRCELVS